MSSAVVGSTLDRFCQSVNWLKAIGGTADELAVALGLEIGTAHKHICACQIADWVEPNGTRTNPKGRGVRAIIWRWKG